MSRDYVRIYREEFDKFMTKYNAEQINPRGTSEVVYRIKLGNELSIWIYSSIRRKSGVSRPTGKDAIRTIMLYQENHGVMKESKTLRTSNWEKNLEQKIRSLQKRATTYQCPWGHPLVKRKHKRGKNLFTSCAAYPKCKYIYRKEKPIAKIYDPENIPPLPENFIWLDDREPNQLAIEVEKYGHEVEVKRLKTGDFEGKTTIGEIKRGEDY